LKRQTKIRNKRNEGSARLAKDSHRNEFDAPNSIHRTKL